MTRIRLTTAAAGLLTTTVVFLGVPAAVVSIAQVREQPAFLTCGTDNTSPAALPVSAANVILAGDSRLFKPCPEGQHPANHLEQRWSAVLAAAARSPQPELRRLAVRAYGDLGRDASALVKDPGSLLKDASPAIRRSAANALGGGLGGADAAATEALLEARLKVETTPEVAQAILESVGRLNYADAAARNHAEAFLVVSATGAPARVLGAVKGLESLFRQDARREIATATRDRLRTLSAMPGTDETSIRTRRLAFIALQTARDLDLPTLERAVIDPDWQVRRLVALRLDLARADMTRLAAALKDDPAPQVRYEVVGAEARLAQQTRTCAPLVRRLADRDTTVVLRALDGVPAGCADLGDVLAVIRPWAESVDRSESVEAWHVPARALIALARIQPEVATPLLARASTHPAWQVRVSAATAAGLVGDDARLEALADDSAANVRTAAIEQLARRKASGAYPAALRALRAGDYQLVRAAATTLTGVPADFADEAVRSLLAALARVTDEQTDTSRDPRVAILGALGSLLPAARAGDLMPYLADYDPAVRTAAERAYQAAAKSAPPAVQPRYRYPEQPAATALLRLPTRASLTLAGLGTLEIELRPSDAPVTVARFAALARAGYYNGLTFHRVVPNFVVQGGSPGANEYVGADRYMRDELGGEPHLRGSVGISTRGRDTGDAQIFIDLVDLPRLDHDYTVFGRVISGLDLLEKILEGARIDKITVR